MALGVKYRLDYDDEAENTAWRADISLEGYVGGVNTMKMGGKPVTIEMRDIDDPFTPICHTEATVTIISESSGQYDEFKTANVYDYVLEIYRGGTIFWQGTLITEPFTEEFISTPYEVELKFTDGISELKFERYDVAGVLQDDFQTVMEVMVKCFNKLPIARNFREIVNLFEDGLNSADTEGLFEQLSLYEGAYWETDSSDDLVKGVDCLKVLECIMYSLKSRLIVSDNKYYIIRIDESKTSGVVKYVDYNSAGAKTGNGTIDLRKSISSSPLPDLLKHLSGASIDISPQYQEVEYRYSSKNITTLENNILINGDFSNGYELENGSPVPLYWGRSAAVNTQLGVDNAGMHVNQVSPDLYWFTIEESMLAKARSGTAWVKDSNDQLDNVVKGAVTTEETYNLFAESPSSTTVTYKNLLHDTADHLELRIKGFFDYTYNDNVPTSYNADYFFKWTIQLGTKYYNTGNQTWDTSINNRVWHREYGDIWIDPLANSNSVNPVRRHFFDFKITLANFADTGTSDLKLTWFVPDTNLDAPVPGFSTAIKETSIVFEKMELGYVSADSTEFEIQKVLGETGSADLRTNRYVSEVCHGDGPSNFSIMSFRLPTTNLKTSVWSSRGGSESLPLYEWDIQDVFTNLGTYRLIFNGDLYGLLELHNVIIGIESKTFLIKGMRFSTKENLYELKLHEVGAFSPVIVNTPQVDLSGITLPTSTENDIPATTTHLESFANPIQGIQAMNSKEIGISSTAVVKTNFDSTNTAKDYPV